MTPEQVEELRKVFPPEQIGKLPRGKTKKAKETPGVCKRRADGGDAPDWQDFFCGGYHALPAIHLDYVGHAAVTHRLLWVDPAWNWEPVALEDDGRPRFEMRAGQPVGLWIKLTVAGVTRLGFGSVEAGKFDPEKQLIGDALRNAAMRFGVALDLWIKGHADEEDEREAPPATPPAPPPAGFSSEEESQAAHNEAAALWRTIPDGQRPDRPKDWPTTREGLDAFNARINAALASALGATETVDGPNTPPEPSEGQHGGAYEHGDLLTADEALAQVADTPDVGSIQHEPDIAGPEVFNGDTGHCSGCGAPVWYSIDEYLHADPDDDALCPLPDNGTLNIAGSGVDVDALYARHHPTVDPKIRELKVKTEVGKMSGPKVLEALTAAGLSTAGPPPDLKARLVEYRLSVLAESG